MRGNADEDRIVLIIKIIIWILKSMLDRSNQLTTKWMVSPSLWEEPYLTLLISCFCFNWCSYFDLNKTRSLIYWYILNISDIWTACSMLVSWLGPQRYKQCFPNKNRKSSRNIILNQYNGTPPLWPVCYDPKQWTQQHIPGIFCTFLQIISYVWSHCY